MSQLGPRNATSAWARAPGPTSGVASAQQLNPSLFTSQMGIGSPFLPQMGLSAASLGLGAGLSAAAFSQPAALNMMQQAQQVAARAALQQQQQQQQQQKNQRTFVGFVTKMQDNYGFVDDDVFFQVNVVRGAMPRIGDRVMVEANYNPSMPFKWNAFRIQLIPPQETNTIPPQQQQQPHQNVPSAGNQRWTQQGPTTAMVAQMAGNSMHAAEMPRRARSPPPRRRSPPPIAPPRRRSPSPPPRREGACPSAMVNLSRAERREPPPKRERERTPPPVAKRERVSPKREEKERETVSPPRRRARIIPRYAVHLPKLALPVDSCGLSMPTEAMSRAWAFSGGQGVMQLRRRYTNLYIPGDFFDMRPAWIASIPLDQPIRMHSPVAFHILDKIIDRPARVDNAILDAPDADSRWQAKVVLLAAPGLDAIRLKAYGLGSDGSLDETVDPHSLTRVISFLVGVRGKGETMAIGGAWSPSLDGANPDSDPQTLIRTAIRTTLALTGIDLSGCTRWYTMVQLRYFRGEKQRTDTVRLFLPDTSALMPNASEFETLQTMLRAQLTERIAQLENAPGGHEIIANKSRTMEEEPQEVVETAKVENAAATDAPTDWTKVDVKSLKVVDLKRELDARHLDSKGVKSVLITRLQEAIENEQRATIGDVEEDEGPGDAGKIADAEPMETDTIGEDDDATIAIDAGGASADVSRTDSKVAHEKDAEKLEKEKQEKRANLERHFIIPKEPGILVYPNRVAKGGKFDCKVMTMSALLDYRADDNKENSFEVALFVEAFQEMLDRAHAFGVYVALSQAMDRETEKKRRDEIEKSRENSTTGTAGGNNESAVASTNSAMQHKCVIGNTEAFAAFAYFDQNLCGYLMERDVEELLSATALGLSRAQVQRVLKRNAARDKINYRLITDHLLDKESGEVKYAPAPCVDAPSVAQLAAGNVSESASAGTVASESENELVMYRGSLFNIAHCVEQATRLDADRLAALQRVDTLENQLKNAKEAKETSEKRKRRLEDDLDRYKKRLHDAEKCLKNSQDDTVQVRTAMQECKKLGEKIVHLVDKVMPGKETKKPPKKEVKKSEESTGNEGPSVKSSNGSPPQQTDETAVAANGDTATGTNEEDTKEELDLKLGDDEPEENAQ